MILAPLDAASRTRSVSFSRFSSTAPSSDEHWIAATFTVPGGFVFAVLFSRAQPPSRVTTKSDPIRHNGRPQLLLPVSMDFVPYPAPRCIHYLHPPHKG